MNEGSVLLQDIRANPDDDGLRLIYADWLDDQGQAERAEFIRVQIELASRDRWVTVDGLVRYTRAPASFMSNEYVRLVEREAALFNWKNLDMWGFHDWERNTVSRNEFEAFSADVCIVLTHRGFPCKVKCLMQNWLDHGKAIYAAHPIERVEITDREPRASTARPGEFLWDDFGNHPPDSSCLPDDLPAVIWRLLTGGRVKREVLSHWHRYSSKKEATDALSRACLAYAKQLTQSPTVEV